MEQVDIRLLLEAQLELERTKLELEQSQHETTRLKVEVSRLWLRIEELQEELRARPIVTPKDNRIMSQVELSQWRDARILELAQRGFSLRSIGKQIYGFSGGDAFYHIRELVSGIEGGEGE